MKPGSFAQFVHLARRAVGRLSAGEASSTRNVRLRLGATAKDDLEGAVLVELSRGPQPLSRIVDRLTDLLIRQEAIQSGGASEVGVWGPATYRRRVLDVLERFDSSLVEVSSPPGDRTINLSAPSGVVA